MRPLEHGLLSLLAVRTLLLGLTLALGLTGPAFGRQLVWLNGADGHGRPFDLRSLRGQVVAVTFTSRYTKDEAHKINQALAARVDRDFAVVTVVDLVGVPSLFHGYAKRRIADEENRGPVHHVVDENGHLKQSFGVEPDKRVDILVIDKDGSLRGRFSGEGQLTAAQQLIDQLRQSISSL
jgi:hypothetical protein